MDPDIIHDPVFQTLLLKFEVASRKLRDSVIAMRSFYLKHHKAPKDETTSEKWRGALLSEGAAQRHEDVLSAAADLLRYAFEIAPHNDSPIHLEELYHLKLAHKERVEHRAGWKKPEPHPRGIEEKVHVDGGPPITLVIHPKHYDYTERAKRARARREPAMPPEDDVQPEHE